MIGRLVLKILNRAVKLLVVVAAHFAPKSDIPTMNAMKNSPRVESAPYINALLLAAVFEYQKEHLDQAELNACEDISKECIANFGLMVGELVTEGYPYEVACQQSMANIIYLAIGMGRRLA